ncbi:hypothetical protein GMDG_08242 [Pseudogymnoascus destructans 20631-21]|uniref:Uncharacterized protein n=1 Tax=Pseudogymnoascus destructans (strain ATCC MYA-4855 / 20631-21) TaxID=658429 RepID=L8G1C2_PSED2|nr:hypothetical protein GMDG_08242 [Pseudogymnoascus destructans 20631-21]
MCSEMWMGTHPKNTSYVISSGLPLADHLKQNLQIFGRAGVDRESKSLFFQRIMWTTCLKP